MIEFEKYGKTPRLFRDIVITEKIDGTNSAVIIQEHDPFEGDNAHLAVVERDGVLYAVAAQSRNRLIFPGKTTDNYGFAGWVQENAEQLFDLLGEGRHFGEWWGQGVARKYDMNEKRFSLFNTERYAEVNARVGEAIIETVPVMYEGEFDQNIIIECLLDLKHNGSLASDGFMNPEGICVYHTQSHQVYKVTLDNNDKGKWEV